MIYYYYHHQCYRRDAIIIFKIIIFFYLYLKWRLKIKIFVFASLGKKTKRSSLFIELIYVNIFGVELLISIEYSNSYASLTVYAGDGREEYYYYNITILYVYIYS